MTLKLVFFAFDVADTEDIRALSEKIGMCFEGLGDARLQYVTRVEDGGMVKVGRGPYRNVMLSDVGVRELEERFGAARAAALIAEFSDKLYQKNYKFKDHFAQIVAWAEEREGETPSADGYTSSDGSAATFPSRGRLPGSDTGGGRAQSFDVDEFFETNIERINGNGNSTND